MVYSLYRLRHYTVIRGNNENGYIGSHSSALSHRCEGCVSRRVEEGYIVAVVVDPVSTDVLGDSACLALGDLGIAYGVKQRGLAVVNVTHNDDDRASRLQCLLGILGDIHYSFLYRDNDGALYFAAHFGHDYLGGIVVDGLIDRRHHTELHELLYDLGRSLFQRRGKLAHRYFLAHRYGDRRLFDLFKLNSAKLIRLGLALCTLRTAVFLRLLLYLLLALDIIAAHSIGRSDILISLVVFIDVDV